MPRQCVHILYVYILSIHLFPVRFLILLHTILILQRAGVQFLFNESAKKLLDTEKSQFFVAAEDIQLKRLINR